MKTRVLRLNCITTAALSALLIAIGVFLGNLGNTEYKSQMRKRKAKKTEQVIPDKLIQDNDVVVGQ